MQCGSSAGVVSQVTTCCVAGHGVQCSRSAFLGETCDAVGLTAAISVASPQQTIGPATPEWQTCDTRLADLQRKMESQHYQEWETCDVLSKGSILVQANVI